MYACPHQESMQLEQVAIPEEVQQGTAEMMFDFLAEKLVAFIEKHYTDLQSGTAPSLASSITCFW